MVPTLDRTLSHLKQTLPLRHLGDVEDVAKLAV